MKELIIVIKKELTELFRERKTLFNLIILPAIIVPIVFFVIIKVGETVEQKNQKQVLNIGLVNVPPNFLELVQKDTLHTFTNFLETENIKEKITDNTVQSVVVFPKNWDYSMNSMLTSKVKIYKNGSKDNANSRVKKLLENYNKVLKEQRMTALHISLEKLTPFENIYIEVGEQKEVIGKKIGGFIPYIFILSMWGGCLLASIDLVTGEKERSTIETTLALPISKFKILFGKTVVASLMGLMPAISNLLGIVVVLKFSNNIPQMFKEALNTMVSFSSVALILLLLIPFSLFLSSMVILLITGASSFKEAQSKATPLIMVVIIPLATALMPGIEFTWSTAFIPILNLGLGIKEIMAGTIDYFKYTAMLLFLITGAIVTVYFSYKKFSDENAILK